MPWVEVVRVRIRVRLRVKVTLELGLGCLKRHSVAMPHKSAITAKPICHAPVSFDSRPRTSGNT
jgi:hypothetical protein